MPRYPETAEILTPGKKEEQETSSLSHLPTAAEPSPPAAGRGAFGRPVVLLAVGVLLLLCPLVMADRFLPNQVFDLGRALNEPMPQFGRFLGLWMFFSAAATASFVAALLGAARGGIRLDRLRQALVRVSDGRWMLAVAVLSAAVPAAIRVLILRQQPLTDDEAAYRFMGQVLASGRLFVESPPFQLFFDHSFLINDGKMYAAYFVGWPALLVPAAWLGVSGFANCLYSALAAPAIFLALRRITSSGWAKVGALLYLSSPMLMIGAATETSHTSCTAALAWLVWFVLRSRDQDAAWWSHAGCAVTFSAAFFIRPTSALGVGLPMLAWWLAGALRGRSRSRWLAVGAFVAPALVGAALFLWVNRVQNGSPFEVGYQRASNYQAEHPSPFLQEPVGPPAGLLPKVLHAAAMSAAAIYRLNFDLFGWPCSLLFIPFCRPGRWSQLLLGSLALYFVVHVMLLPDVGVDSFAPMHFFETSLPLLLLTVSGLERLSALGRRIEDLQAPDRARAALSLRSVPGLVTATLILVSVSSFHPLRWIALRKITASIELPQRALEESGVSRAVIFAPRPFIAYCRSGGARGWVFEQPINDPQLEDDVLWVNHISVGRDRELMQSFPDRRGWILTWERPCTIGLLRVESAAADRVPDAVGLNRIPAVPGS